MPQLKRRPARQARASRALESLALAAADADTLATAQRRWADLDISRQLQLAQVLADCRRAEFTRKIRNVVQVAAGFKRIEDEQGREFLHRCACIVFVVRRKLPSSRLPQGRDQAVPGFLLTPAWVDGCDRMVAVPTDVQQEEQLLGARSQAASAIAVERSPSQGNAGSVAWVLKAGDQQTYALAPIHVLSPLPRGSGQGIVDDTEALRLANATRPFDTGAVLRATAHGGRLAAHPVRSFDAQFGKVLDRARLRKALHGIELSAQHPWARGIGDIGDRTLEIPVPSNHLKRRVERQEPLIAKLSLAPVDTLLTYRLDSGEGTVTHRVMQLQLLFGAVTLEGDSGCPVLLRNDDDTLTFAGMHIAGDTLKRLSFVIPAWDLMNEEKYLEVGGSVPPGPWRLLVRA